DSDAADTKVRSTRNLMLVFALALAVFNVVFGLFASAQPGLLPLCIKDGKVCATGPDYATGGDIWLLQGAGMGGAIIGVIVLMLRNQPKAGTYTLPFFQSVIKLELGAA